MEITMFGDIVKYPCPIVVSTGLGVMLEIFSLLALHDSKVNTDISNAVFNVVFLNILELKINVGLRINLNISSLARHY